MNNKKKIQQRLIRKRLKLQKELEEYATYSERLPIIIRDLIKNIIVEYGMFRIKNRHDNLYEDVVYSLQFKNNAGSFLSYLIYDNNNVRIAVDRIDTFNKFNDSYLDITLTQNSKKSDYKNIYQSIQFTSNIDYKAYFGKKKECKNTYLNVARKSV